MNLFRLDYDPSFSRRKTKNLDFIIDYGRFEIDKERLMLLNWKGAERFIKELKEKMRYKELKELLIQGI